MSRVTPLLKRCRSVVDGVRHTLRWYESEAKITRDAQKYWDAPPAHKRDLYSHWRTGFDSKETWLEIGRESYDLFVSFARSMQLATPVKRVVEWGSGGGANAVHFGKTADEFYGVDITQSNLDECSRQMTEAGLTNFKPVLIAAATPETALNVIPRECDLFICFYVFEVFPTPEYGIKILKIAAQMLRKGGMAIIHIKYPTGLGTRSRRWGYRFGVASMTTYRLDDFWETAKTCGFKPHAVSLMPKAPLVQDERYAYFVLSKE
jgi:2-polyprenyl-3-methyl-5-hydroxy-6-metoxy-1,4-benzoquinol methylase